ncbi:MAG: PEP-CTERM sorting domain-containing protein [Isosphaerales bacterium]
MTRGTNGSWLLAGLAILGVVFAGGSEARAGSIKITGSIVPLPGHSPFLYTFSVLLTGGTIQPGTTADPTQFTVSGLVGVTGLSEHQEPPLTGNPLEVWNVPTGGIATSSTGNPPPFDEESSVMWQYSTGPTITYGGTPISLGTFTVQTTGDFPDNNPPVTPGVTLIDYFYSLYNPTGESPTGSGSITLSSVPEPSSVILLLVGAGVLPLLVRLGRCSRSP